MRNYSDFQDEQAIPCGGKDIKEMMYDFVIMCNISCWHLSADTDTGDILDQQSLIPQFVYPQFVYPQI